MEVCGTTPTPWPGAAPPDLPPHPPGVRARLPVMRDPVLSDRRLALAAQPETIPLHLGDLMRVPRAR